MDNNFNLNSTSILQKIWLKRRLMLIVALIAVVVSLVVTLLIPNKFEARAVIMAPVANQISKEIFTSSLQNGLTVFGESEEAEQLEQIVTSRTLKDKVINSLNLWQLWGMDSTAKHGWAKMYSAYHDCVRVKMTKYQGVEVAVRNQSPELAARMANAVVDFSDSLMRAVKRQVAQRALQVYEEQYRLELEAITATEDSMRRVMLTGVTSPMMQTKEFAHAYAQATMAGNRGQMGRLEQQMLPVQELGSRFIRYRFELEHATENLMLLRNYLRVLQIEAKQDIPTQFVIDRAVVPDKKIAPKRILLVVLSTLSALLLAVVAMVCIDFFETSLSTLPKKP